MRCPTTCRRSRSLCCRTASCWSPRRRASSATRSSRRRSPRPRRSRGRPCDRLSAARRSGCCCCWSRARSTPSRRLPLPPGWIDEPLLPEPVRLTAGRTRARLRVDVTFGRRGRRVLPPPALVLRDPFGLAERVLSGEHADEVMVLPRVLPVRATANGGEGIHAHARAALVAAAETEIDGLREHREGSPAS